MFALTKVTKLDDIIVLRPGQKSTRGAVVNGPTSDFQNRVRLSASAHVPSLVGVATQVGSPGEFDLVLALEPEVRSLHLSHAPPPGRIAPRVPKKDEARNTQLKSSKKVNLMQLSAFGSVSLASKKLLVPGVQIPTDTAPRVKILIYKPQFESIEGARRFGTKGSRV